MLSELLSQNLEYHSSFLNWVICTTDGAAEFFERYSNNRFSVSDLVIDYRLEIPKSQIWIMHDHPREGSHFTQEDLERIASKFEYMRRKLFDLRGMKRRIFVICNCDNNLTEHYMWNDGRMDFSFDRQRLNRLKYAIDYGFPHGENRLVVTGRRDRVDKVDWSYGTAILDPDNSDWQGDDGQWDKNAPLIAFGKLRMPLLPQGWRRPQIQVPPLAKEILIRADDDRLKTQIGAKIGGQIRLNGERGWGLYGPYVPLAPGFYEMTINFSDSPLKGRAAMDIAGGNSTQSFVNRFIYGGNCGNGKATLRVTLPRDTIKVEVRLYCDEDFSGSIHSIKINRIDV